MYVFTCSRCGSSVEYADKNAAVRGGWRAFEETGEEEPAFLLCPVDVPLLREWLVDL